MGPFSKCRATERAPTVRVIMVPRREEEPKKVVERPQYDAATAARIAALKAAKEEKQRRREKAMAERKQQAQQEALKEKQLPPAFPEATSKPRPFTATKGLTQGQRVLQRFELERRQRIRKIREEQDIINGIYREPEKPLKAIRSEVVDNKGNMR